MTEKGQGLFFEEVIERMAFLMEKSFKLRPEKQEAVILLMKRKGILSTGNSQHRDPAAGQSLCCSGQPYCMTGRVAHDEAGNGGL